MRHTIKIIVALVLIALLILLLSPNPAAAGSVWPAYMSSMPSGH